MLSSSGVHAHTNHSTVHLITLKSIHGEQVELVRMRHVCREVFFNWADELPQPWYYQYPPKFQDHYNSTFFEKWGVKGVGGHIILRNITENRLYKRGNITHVPGRTLMPECHWQHFNPAHIMFPYSVLFEWGQSPPSHLPVFDQLMLMKCPSWGEYLHHWEWARIVEEASVAPLLEKGYFGKDVQKEALDFARSRSIDLNVTYPAPKDSTHPYSYVLSPEMRYEHDLPEFDGRGDRGRVRTLNCFDTVYIVQRWGVLMDTQTNARLFREKAVETFHKRYPNDKITRPEIDDDPIAILDRCRNKSLRILIQQRSPVHMDRVFMNTKEVLEAVSNYTSHARNVHMFIDRFNSQVQLYNSFDILVTTTGSHLTNLIFTNRSRVVVLEVGLAIRDWFWRDNAHRFGIQHYMYSHQGHVPSPKCYKEGKVDNTCHSHATVEDAMICPPRKDDSWHPIGDCSLFVNISTFKVRLKKAIDNLCNSIDTDQFQDHSNPARIRGTKNKKGITQ